jgi:hypothetical protein
MFRKTALGIAAALVLLPPALLWLASTADIMAIITAIITMAIIITAIITTAIIITATGTSATSMPAAAAISTAGWRPATGLPSVS